SRTALQGTWTSAGRGRPPIARSPNSPSPPWIERPASCRCRCGWPVSASPRRAWSPLRPPGSPPSCWPGSGRTPPPCPTATACSPTTSSSSLPRRRRGCGEPGRVGLEIRQVEHDPVAHVTPGESREGIVDARGGQQLDVSAHPMCGAELEHLRGPGHPSTAGRGELPPPHEQGQGLQRDRPEVT